MQPGIGILALGAANRASIACALERAGARPEFVDSAQRLREVDAIVFPGVAHFGYVIGELDRRELRAPLLASIASGMPYLGICAGFQILFDGSDEAPAARGLGVFSGTVQRVRGSKSPHMGWNTVVPLDAQLSDIAGWAYFAHEFAPPAATASVTATTVYGSAFASVAEEGAVSGVQFHPELKSRPLEPHPLFTSFIAAAVQKSRLA